MRLTFTLLACLLTCVAYAQKGISLSNASKGLVAKKDTVIESDTTKENKEPQYFYFSVNTNVFVNTKGCVAKRFSPAVEFGRTYGIFDIGLATGQFNISHGSDTARYIEFRPTINVFSSGRFAEGLCLGGGYVFSAKQGLRSDLPVAIFVVIHLSRKSRASIIQRTFQKLTDYTVTVPADKERIRAGHLYVAVPDSHLFIKEATIRLTNGPHENRWRPSIDVLFRSAAAAYGFRVIGIILTGMLDDGTSGMSAIKRSGGTCIVQEPEEAEFQDMPVNVFNNIEVDHRLPVAEMSRAIIKSINKEKPPANIPADVIMEAAITERITSSIEEMEKIATHSNYTCPDCGGGLWEITNDTVRRYRCHTGHVYTEKLLAEKQGEEMEESLWASIRMMEERRNLLKNMAWHEQQCGREAGAATFQQRADELGIHVDRLKKLLVSVHQAEPDDDGYL